MARGARPCRSLVPRPFLESFRGQAAITPVRHEANGAWVFHSFLTMTMIIEYPINLNFEPHRVSNGS